MIACPGGAWTWLSLTEGEGVALTFVKEGFAAFVLNYSVGDYSESPNSAKALIAYAGIDAPPYQSGQFTGTKRHISKRGDSNLRKLGYELMDSVNKHKSLYGGDPVCEYFIKKRNEGKPYRVAMIAAFNKFLRIYHSKVSAVLNGNDKKK